MLGALRAWHCRVTLSSQRHWRRTGRPCSQMAAGADQCSTTASSASVNTNANTNANANATSSSSSSSSPASDFDRRTQLLKKLMDQHAELYNDIMVKQLAARTYALRESHKKGSSGISIEEHKHLHRDFGVQVIGNLVEIATASGTSLVGNPHKVQQSVAYFQRLFVKNFGPSARFMTTDLCAQLLHMWYLGNNVTEMRCVWETNFQADKLLPNVDCLIPLLAISESQSLAESDEIWLKAVLNPGVLSSLDIGCQDIMSAKMRHHHRAPVMRALSKIFPNERLEVPLEPCEYSSEIVLSLNERDSSRLESSLPDDYKVSVNHINRQLATEIGHGMYVPSVLRVGEPSERELQLAASRKTLMAEFRKQLDAGIQERQKRAHRFVGKEFNKEMMVSIMMSALPVNKLVDVMLDKLTLLLSNIKDFSPPVTMIMFSLGIDVMQRLRVFSSTEKDPHGFSTFIATCKDYMNWVSSPKDSKDGAGSWCHREEFLKLAARHMSTRSDDMYPDTWNLYLHTIIGRELFRIMLRSLCFYTDEKGELVLPSSDAKPHSWSTKPALFKVYRTRKSFATVQEVKVHPCLTTVFNNDALSDLFFPANELPMVVPPLPWLDHRQGGYLLYPNDLIRLQREDSFAQPASRKVENKQLHPLLDSLNQMGSTPWKTNKAVLDTLIEIFRNQERYADYLDSLSVAKDPSLFVLKPKLSSAIRSKVKSGARLSPEEHESYRDFSIAKRNYQQLKNEGYSLWCTDLYRISVANHFRDDVIYFPHNLDFRGRCYPIPPHLNHMGGDLARGLLVFAKGKRIGRHGLSWLKLHIVNLTEIKKRCSVEERLAYFKEILDDVLDSARNPLNGRRWWMSFEDPWQLLGACIELERALSLDNPEDFITHLPIHQDGSCNGLQHYAALGRDTLGAKYVNVLPSGVPQDVYSEIAAIVERKREMDAESGKKIAQTLEGFVQRKVVKQTIMTTVYGVTVYGARLQIARQLRDLDDFPLDMVKPASSYLAAKVFESLNETFKASQEIQNWFLQCAKYTCGLLKENVSWNTPMGLYVKQPYYSKTKSITPDQSFNFEKDISWCVARARAELRRGPNKVKNMNGFPPNFIHSLDSTHMMLTSLSMWNAGHTFASVHDCYWTHATCVDEMNEICRNQFVKLHSSPILEDLSEHFLSRLAAHSSSLTVDEVDEARGVFRAIPEKGTLELEEVKNSTFFFS